MLLSDQQVELLVLLYPPTPIMPCWCYCQPQVWNVTAFKYSSWMGHMFWAGQSPAPILKLSRVTEGRESQGGQEDQEDQGDQEDQVRTSPAGGDQRV